METRDEAVAFLVAQGVYAAKRDWVLGETVVVAADPSTDASTGITLYARCVCIIPVDAGWTVKRMGPVRGAAPRAAPTLRAACDAALALLAVDEPLPSAVADDS